MNNAIVQQHTTILTIHYVQYIKCWTEIADHLCFGRYVESFEKKITSYRSPVVINKSLCIQMFVNPTSSQDGHGVDTPEGTDESHNKDDISDFILSDPSSIWR